MTRLTWRWSRFALRGRKLFLLVLVLLVLVPPSAAYAFTRYRYLSGTSQQGVNVAGTTDCCLDRVYNNAYHSDVDKWYVDYRDGGDNLTWLVESYTTPTSQGQTTGPRKSQCGTRIPNSSGIAYNCDTTVP